MNYQTDLALVGPTLSGSNDELAVMAESGISPEFMPSAVRHSPECTHRHNTTFYRRRLKIYTDIKHYDLDHMALIQTAYNWMHSVTL